MKGDEFTSAEEFAHQESEDFLEVLRLVHVYLYLNSSCCSDISIAGKSRIKPIEIVITRFPMPASSKLLIYFPLKNSGDTISGIHGLEPGTPTEN